MNMDIRWAKLSAAYGDTPFASLLRRKRRNQKLAPKDALREWENEGGTLASPPEATGTLVTTGSA